MDIFQLDYAVGLNFTKTQPNCIAQTGKTQPINSKRESKD
jgi:hypothetical protein